MGEILISDRGRGPGLDRIRITVYDLIPYWLRGWQTSHIAAVFPITVVEAEALIRYIEEHRDEVMAVHQRIEERIARGNPPEVEARLEVNRAKLRALQEELRLKHLRDGELCM